MWKFKPFMPKEQTGLEGRTIDIGNIKVHVRNTIAEGGFSSVYLARDAIHGSKQYALKHIVCNDEESLELVKKEISVMKLLKGHPNVVALCAHAIFDMGRTQETLLVMEYCEKSLVNVLDNRGADFFDEKQILTIFRDVCNAVFAMHCQSPPIAHRDLKAENLLLGSDGIWKLCDFGSTSINHKRFEKPEEMGIEEDNIRKYTTPAYRAPEMWDLFRRELINEKVDIWALGCLLYRICYLKLAFDGESKLQVLNGNYRIPEVPKYSSSVTDLIRDMLQSSPDARPDITQVWFRVNDLLPDGLQKSVPDRPPEMQQHGTNVHEGTSRPAVKSNPMPRRNPPPPPTAAEPARNVSPPSQNSRSSGTGGALGAFWTTQHAQGSSVLEDAGRTSNNASIPEKDTTHVHPVHKSVPLKSVHEARDGSSKDFEINFFQDDLDRNTERVRAPKPESATAFGGQAFNAFVAEFGSKVSPQNDMKKTGKEEALEAEIERLKEQLSKVNMEKVEMTSKYEKLSAICRSQRQEVQELKETLAARTPSPNKDALKAQTSTGNKPSTPSPSKERTEGTVWELQQGLFDQISTSSDKTWQPFADNSTTQTPVNNTSRSVRTKNGYQNKPVAESQSSTGNAWGFGSDNFRAVPNPSHVNAPGGEMNKSQRFSETKNIASKQASQPAGWAGF